MGHEILIIDDGSNDGSYSILSKCKFITLIHLKKTRAKAYYKKWDCASLKMKKY